MLRQFTRNPAVSMVVDANDMLGAEVRSATGPKQPAIVDGKMGAIENAMLKAPLNPQQNWVWLHSKRNLDILGFMDYVGNFDAPFSLALEDDQQKSKGELFPGHLPGLGYRINNLPDSGSLGIVVSIYSSEHFDGEPEQVARNIRSQPDMQIMPFQAAL